MLAHCVTYIIYVLISPVGCTFHVKCKFMQSESLKAMLGHRHQVYCWAGENTFSGRKTKFVAARGVGALVCRIIT